MSVCGTLFRCAGLLVHTNCVSVFALTGGSFLCTG